MNLDDQRVVITGLAASTHWGLGAEALFSRLKDHLYTPIGSGHSNRIHKNGALGFPEITHDLSHLLRRTRADYQLTCQLLAAAELGFRDSLNSLEEHQKKEVGVVIGEAMGNYEPYFNFYTTGTREGYEFVNPVHFPTTLFNYSTVTLNRAYGLQGSSTTISSGFSSGLDAIGYAAMLLQHSQDNMIIAGGVQAFNDAIDQYFCTRDRLITMSDIHPFQENRGCAIPGEAVAALLLEPLSLAQANERVIYAEILGYGSARGKPGKSNADIAQRAGDALHQALRNSVLDVSEIEAIIASANGSTVGDALEATMLSEVFDHNLDSIPVYPIKQITGECLAASGTLQCLAAVFAITLDPYSFDQEPEPKVRAGIQGLHLPERIRPCSNALVYSFGLDHTCSAVVIGRV